MAFTVAIVGRPNVGKSTIFNRLVGRRLALVDDTPGLTRDRREGHVDAGGLSFTVIDTAGLEESTGDTLEARMLKVVVTDLKENTFFAVLHLQLGETEYTVDSRPSDALALALRMDCPIFVDDGVLKSSKLAANLADKGNDELRKYLEGLNDDDLGKYKM